MDIWKFFDITHRNHIFYNPMDDKKFDDLIRLIKLNPKDRVLDMATGKGEFLIRLAERYNIKGTGIDISPYCIDGARKKHRKRIPDAGLEFIEMNGAEYKADQSCDFKLAACIGASRIYGGYKETLTALNEIVPSGGLVIVGEPYWRQEPDENFLDAICGKRSTYGTHYDNMKTALDLNLELIYTIVSNGDDWDRYEGLQWHSANEWAKENPDDADVKEVLERVKESRENYLRWGRDTFGWAVYMFRKVI